MFYKRDWVKKSGLKPISSVGRYAIYRINDPAALCLVSQDTCLCTSSFASAKMYTRDKDEPLFLVVHHGILGNGRICLIHHRSQQMKDMRNLDLKNKMIRKLLDHGVLTKLVELGAIDKVERPFFNQNESTLHWLEEIKSQFPEYFKEFWS